MISFFFFHIFSNTFMVVGGPPGYQNKRFPRRDESYGCGESQPSHQGRSFERKNLSERSYSSPPTPSTVVPKSSLVTMLYRGTAVDIVPANRNSFVAVASNAKVFSIFSSFKLN